MSRDQPTSESEPPAEFDWSAFWATADEEQFETAHVSRVGKAVLLRRFFEETTVPDSMGFFGCGPATCPFAIADHYPSMSVSGYDAASYIIERNRRRARETGTENISFAVDRLPDLDTDRTFDCVYCYATLHYVRDIESAVQALYDRVTPGGYLIFNYPNTFTRRKYDREFDDDAPRERFELVLEGANLLSYRAIRDTLGAQPRSYWSLVDAPDVVWVDRSNPCVYLRTDPAPPE